MDLKNHIRNIPFVRRLLQTKKCVTPGKYVGSGAYGTVYELVIGPKLDIGPKLVIKIETDSEKDVIKKEFNLTNACTALVTSGKCINFMTLYGVFKFDGLEFNNAIKNEKLVLMKNSDKISYGIVMEQADKNLASVYSGNRKYHLFKSIEHDMDLKFEKIKTIDVFWQIAMALFSLRTQLGYFHNDTTPGNIFLTKVDKPYNIIYRNGELQRVVRLGKGDYYATLGDFGLSSETPIAFLSKYPIKIDVSIATKKRELCTPLGGGQLNFVSDLNRLINETKIQTELEPLFMKELCDVYEEIGQYVSTTGEENLILNFKTKDSVLSSLYNNELGIFSKYAFNEPFEDYHESIESIVCDMTPSSRDIRDIPDIKMCTGYDTSTCVSNFKDNDRQLCKVLTTIIRMSERRKQYKPTYSTSKNKRSNIHDIRSRIFVARRRGPRVTIEE